MAIASSTHHREWSITKLLIIFALIKFISCYTEFEGQLRTSQTFTVDGSPYLIKSDLIIPDNKKLKIDPGVRVEFLPGVGIKVKGQLIAQGTEDKKIIFTSKNHGTWRGIPKDIRLTQGSSVLNGKLELFYKGSWRSVCTNSKNWTQVDINTACRQLGFGSGRFLKWFEEPANYTKQLLFQTPNCSPSSDSLFQCSWSTCKLGGGACDDHLSLGIECDAHNDTDGQYWKGIQFMNAMSKKNYYLKNTFIRVESISILEHTEITFAGINEEGTYTSAIQSIGIPPVILKSTVKWSAFNGMNITAPNDGFSLTRCKVIQNRGFGIFINTSQGMSEIKANTLISNNGGDGIRFVFHNRVESGDSFCPFSSYGSAQSYPKQLIQSVTYDKPLIRPCKKIFTSKGLPGQIMTIHYLTLRNDVGSKAAFEIYDESIGSDVLIDRFILKNESRPSISSSGKSIAIKFIPDRKKETYFAIEITTSIGKAADFNITDSVIEKNIGSGIQVENLRSSAIFNRSAIKENSLNGISIIGGTGDVMVNNSKILKNMADGVNITYDGGRQVISKTEIEKNLGNGISIWLNHSTDFSFRSQHVEISFSKFHLNGKVGVFISNFCRSDSFTNISMNHFTQSLDSSLIYQSCWHSSPFKTKDKHLLISNNKFIQNKKLSIRLQPAFNIDAVLEHNLFADGQDGVILVENENFEDYNHLSTNVLIQENLFRNNSGSFVCRIGLTEESVLQKLIFTRNRLENNEIKQQFPNLSPRNKAPAVVAVSSSNTEIFRNVLENPKSIYELASHVQGHYITINATYNYWGNYLSPEDIYNRIFDVKNRYNLARVEFHPYLKIGSDLGTEIVSTEQDKVNVMIFQNDQLLGGEIMGEFYLGPGSYTVERDIFVNYGSTLTISPGTTLKFKQSLGMMVQGRLISEALDSNPIIYSYTEESMATDLKQSVKLTGGNEGKLMVKIGEKWGTICRYGWTMRDASIACNQMGYVLNPNDWILENVDVFNVTISNEISGILMNNVQCTDFDTDITRCIHESVEDFENSCEEEVAIRCYEPSWAGVQFGIMAEHSKLENCIVEKAGLYDYHNYEFRPGLQLDFNHHSLKKLTFRDNFDSGLGILLNDMFYSQDQVMVESSVFEGNNLYGIVSRSQGTNIKACSLIENTAGGVLYDQRLSNHESKDLMRWLNLKDDKNIITIDDENDLDELYLKENEWKFIVIRPGGKLDKSRSERKLKIRTKSIHVLGIQIINPIHRNSSEDVIIYDFKDVNNDEMYWNLKKNLTAFPRLSTSYVVNIVYNPGNLPYGRIVLSVKSVSRYAFHPKLLIQGNKIERCGSGISTVFYNRDFDENGDLYLRNGNESIIIKDTSLISNEGPAFVVDSPFLNPFLSNLAQINISIVNITVRHNGGIIKQQNRNSRYSNNLFHWNITDSVFENNLGALRLDFPYVWNYDENNTHSLNISGNTFQDNTDFELLIKGHFANVTISNNQFLKNQCTRGLIDIGGMEKDIEMMKNKIIKNRGHHMVRFNIHSHSSKFGVVPSNFYFNTMKDNSYFSPRHDYDDQGYHPSSYTLGLLGIQLVNVSHNLFSNNVLQFELLTGIRIGSVQDEVNVTNNWWGTTTYSEIKKKIFDFDQWNSYAIAKFVPFLSSDNFEAQNLNFEEEDGNLDLTKELGGRISQSMTIPWRSEPYIVKLDLTVMPGCTLSIDAGVEMQFYPSVGILVLGKLSAIGKSYSPIIMKPLVKQNYGVRYSREVLDKPLIRLCIDEKCSDKRRDGFLEIYNSTTMHWVPVCDERFTEWNAQVVCHELGYSTRNVYVDKAMRNDLLYSQHKLNLVRFWPEPLQCEGDEARYSDCQYRINEFSEHNHRCHAKSQYVYINCGELNTGDDFEYWGGIRFSVPNFEQNSINMRYSFTNHKDKSVLEHVNVIGAGILHGYKTGAIQTSLTTAYLNYLKVSKSAYHGINSVASVGTIEMYKNQLFNNLGSGLNVLSLFGASVTGDSLLYTPVKYVDIPYHVFGMVDICDPNKLLNVKGRVLLYYKYTNKPIDCVKIFSSPYGTKLLGFRLLQFNLFDSSHWSMSQDVLKLYDGNIFNATSPTIAELFAFKHHDDSDDHEDDHESDHHESVDHDTSDEPKYHKQFYRSTKGTLSVSLHANGASGKYGFVAEVITLDNSQIISHDLKHNFTNCVFENNDKGAVQYITAGEGTADISFHFNTFKENGRHLFGNFTTSDSAVEIKIQNTPSLLLINNLFHKNQGGLHITSYGAFFRASLEGFIVNNLFYENKNRETLVVRGPKSLPSAQKVNVALNTFAFNYSPYRDNIVFSQVVSNFTENLVMNNTGRHNFDVHWFYSTSSQTCIGNWFHNNKALWLKNKATILASTGGQIFNHNYFVNPDNDFELVALNRSSERRFDFKEEAINASYNWWGYNETIAVLGRIRDQYDNDDLLKVNMKNFYMNNKTVLSDDGKCGPGYILVGKTCILYVGGILPFEKAKTFCEDSDAVMPFIRGNEEILSILVERKQQYDYERYLKVWIQSVDVTAGSCPALLDGEIIDNDCNEYLPFLCEKDPDIIISTASWFKDIMTIIALSVIGCALILMIPCFAFWFCKSKQRQQEKFERRNSIRASIRSNRNAVGFGELGYKRRFDAHHKPPIQPSAFKISNSFTNGSIDSFEKNPSRFDSSVEDNRSYEIYEAHNSQISYPKYDEDKLSKSDIPPYDDKFCDDPQLEEENIKMAVNPTFDYAIPNKGYLDQSYSQPSHDSSHEWGSSDSTYDTKQSIDFSQMLNGYGGYHDAATLPRNTPSAESAISQDTKKSQPLETAM